MASLLAQVKAYLHTCRYEYFPGEAPAMLVPIFLAAQPGQPLLHLDLVLGLVAFLLLFLSGFTINAYTDRKLDENYDSFKRNISSSVRVLGARRLLHITIAQVVVAVIISGSGSSRQFIQRLGRVLRKRPGKQAVLYELVSADTAETHMSARRRQR